MEYVNLRLLDLAQNEDNLDLFKTIGYNAIISDFALILGGYADKNNFGTYYTQNDAELYERQSKLESADYRVKNDPSYYNGLDEDSAYRRMSEDEIDDYIREIEEISTDNVYAIAPERKTGKINLEDTPIYDFQTGIRPVVDTKKSDNPIWKTATRNELGVLEVEYGEYPQTVVDANTERKLALMYQAKLLETTEKNYTFVTNDDLEDSTDFKPTDFQEFITEDGKKYIRINYQNIDEYELSNGKTYTNDQKEAIWVEVKPVKWYIDEKTGLAISANILSAGCPFKNSDLPYDGEFDNTDIADQLFNMGKNLIPSKTKKLDKIPSIFVDPEVVEALSSAKIQEENTVGKKR